MKTNHIIINGDSRCMREVSDSSVHLVITSPPYWQLKDYGTDNQIGFNDSYESYINNLNLVWKESFRVLDGGCRLCINIGDQFARSVYYGRYKVIPIRTEIIKFCETIGFDYMGAVIWQKVTTTNTTGGATIMGSFPYPRNGILKLDYEFILIFKKVGTTPKVSKENKELSKLTTEEWNTYFQGHWNFGGAKQDSHIAMFPEELPKRLIKMFSFVGDTVLDPFLGSGTTSLAAKNLNRNSVGYEINHEFVSIIKKKLAVNEDKMFEAHSLIFLAQEKLQIDFNVLIKKQPYIFRDPHKLDKKIDVKKLQFGSKLDNNGSMREEYFSVKEIISPEVVRLNNDLVIRLIGIKENKEVNGKAIEFLMNKTKGQKVFLKYDEQKYDEKNRLLCYLYLQNKTFINAHLIKEGLAIVDTRASFKHKNKFLHLLGDQNG
ncbi:MAG: modification methylase MjaI [Ignavibacteria bacterium]|nr:MAG: modification methylase MjaI [Ignavibacteria bacterium]KAF0160396.1 MAG: modification methylase MjaI [Ignavibacteria bacterium]